MSDWSEAKDGEGRTYYFNSKTQATSWEKPAEMSTGGWAEVKTEDGKVYYHNAGTGATQWDPPPGFAPATPAAAAAAAPQAAKAAAPAAAAAAPSAAAVVPKRAPTAASTAASSGPMTTDEKLAARAKKFIAARRQEKQRATPSAYARKKTAGMLKYPNGAPASAVPTAKGNTVPALPTGWSSAVDPGSGKEYFFSADGQTSWERPTAPPN